VSVVRNSVTTDEGRGLLERLQSYVQTHDVIVNLPGASHLTLSSRNIDNGELNFSLKFDQEESSANATEGKHISGLNVCWKKMEFIISVVGSAMLD
jgi:hypothetical protein